jgi:hypothetical protein
MFVVFQADLTWCFPGIGWPCWCMDAFGIGTSDAGIPCFLDPIECSGQENLLAIDAATEGRSLNCVALDGVSLQSGNACCGQRMARER